MTTLAFSGCWPCPEPEVVYKVREKEVVIQGDSCKTPDVYCNFIGLTPEEKAKLAGDCIAELVEANKVCK